VKLDLSPVGNPYFVTEASPEGGAGGA